ncbi:MAG: hypothetical protein WC490_08025 [Candidatus Margulisiibacteriota bacterium]
MVYKAIAFWTIIAGLVTCLSADTLFAAEEKLVMKETEIAVAGRLLLQPRKKVERLVLFGKNGRAYILRGDFNEILKGTLTDLGETNLVSLTGIADGLYDIGCTIKHMVDEEGKKTSENECIRYYHLTVTKVLEAKQSDEKMPPPERDSNEEHRAQRSSITYRPGAAQGSIVTVDAKIESLNIKSPIKTMNISFEDKNGKTIKKDILLTGDTRIAKKSIDASEPVFLESNALAAGQKIHLEYAASEDRNSALFITILKE